MWNKLSNSTLNGEIEHTKCTQWDSISIKFKGRKKKCTVIQVRISFTSGKIAKEGAREPFKMMGMLSTVFWEVDVELHVGVNIHKTLVSCIL